MSKTKSYFTILAIAVIIIAAGYIMNIAAIKSFTSQCLTFAGQNILSVSAAVCAFIFLGSKNYWLIILGCAIAAAFIIQFAIIGHGAGAITIAARTDAFLASVFLMNFIKVLNNK